MSEQKEKDLVLTDKLLDQLKKAGALGFDVKDSFPYVPKAYRIKAEAGEFEIPKSLWCIFTLKSKDGIESADAEDAAGYMTYDTAAHESKMFLQTGKARVSNLESGILKVKNLYCEDGSRIDFDKEKKELITVSSDGKVHKQNGVQVKALIRKIKAEMQLELANAINERSTLTEEETRGLGY